MRWRRLKPSLIRISFEYRTTNLSPDNNKRRYSSQSSLGAFMQLSVKGKQIDVGDALRSHVETQLKEITGKYFSSPLDAHVTFSREAHLFRADIAVHAGRGILLQSNATRGRSLSGVRCGRRTHRQASSPLQKPHQEPRS